MLTWRARSLCAAALLVVLAAQAHANYSCAGPVTYLAVSSGGSVYVRVAGHGVWAICNVSEQVGVIKPETCRAWYATLLANQKVQKSIALYFTSSGSESECSQIGDWVMALPYHMDTYE
jgi:hypothetical protein